MTSDRVHVNQTGEHIAGSPPYDPKMIEAPITSDWEPFYGYYGLSPYWGNGYMYPNFPIGYESRSAKRCVRRRKALTLAQLLVDAHDREFFVARSIENRDPAPFG